MYYLISKTANIGRKIITENHPTIKMHLKEIDYKLTAESVIKWLWGIDKKSENLLDLIEPGDLVMGLETFDEKATLHLITADHNSLVFECGVGKYVAKSSITTIYKPNSNGDFIKAWEKDNEYYI
jgi:hypothetical protein